MGKFRDWNAVDAHFRNGGPMKHKNTPRGGSQNITRELIHEVFKCEEHCHCYGEGTCDWCISRCDECGGTKDQHPATKKMLVEQFGEDHEAQGFFVHDFRDPRRSAVVEDRWVCLFCHNLLKREHRNYLTVAEAHTFKTVGVCCADTLPTHLRRLAMRCEMSENPKPSEFDERFEPRLEGDPGATLGKP